MAFEGCCIFPPSSKCRRNPQRAQNFAESIIFLSPRENFYKTKCHLVYMWYNWILNSKLQLVSIDQQVSSQNTSAYRAWHFRFGWQRMQQPQFESHLTHNYELCEATPDTECSDGTSPPRVCGPSICSSWKDERPGFSRSGPMGWFLCLVTAVTDGLRRSIPVQLLMNKHN